MTRPTDPIPAATTAHGLRALLAKLPWWAGASSARDKTSRRPAGAVATASSQAQGVSRAEFDALIGEAFRVQGFQIVDGVGAGGRVDMVLRRERQTYLVQCKHWQAQRVDAAAVNVLCEVIGARAAAGGFMLTAGRFSREASALASAHNIRLIEGPALTAMLKQARAARAAVR